MNDGYERAVEEVRALFDSRGTKVLKGAAASVLRERIECAEARGALSQFMSDWRDVVRPSLVSLACEAAGGDPSAAAPVGRALTLLSGATDIHDDIIDKTTVKRRKKTVLGRFGGDIALMAGDALIFKGFTELFDGLAGPGIPAGKKLAIVRTVKDLYFEMFDGEALELRFRARTDVRPGEYLRVLGKKAADVEACLRAGAMLGNGGDAGVDAMGGYGRLLGTIVLLRNDLEDMLDPGLLDLRVRNESLPLPVLWALANRGKRGEILAILKKGELSRKDAKRLLRLVSEAGAIGELEKLLASLKKRAASKIRGLKLGGAFEAILSAAVPEKLDVTGQFV